MSANRASRSGTASRARSQYAVLPAEQRPEEMLATYERLAAQGIRLIDVAEQVRTVDLASVPEAHFELPFDDGAAPSAGVTARGAAVTTTAS